MVVQVEEAVQAPVVPDRVLDRSLAETDPEVNRAISAELTRQQTTLEMIASENFAPVAVMRAQGSVLTNKYAEGYPGRRYYGGCEHVDVIEQLAIDRLKALFGAEYANVQPHSGAQANAAAMAALLAGARLLAERLLAPDSRAAGVNVVSGGTDVHLVLVDLRESALDGRQAEERLHAIGITVNRNAVPFDARPPMVSSGIRIGTPALAARGFGPDDFAEVSDVIAAALRPLLDDEQLAGLRTRVTRLAGRHPLYPDLTEAGR